MTTLAGRIRKETFEEDLMVKAGLRKAAFGDKQSHRESTVYNTIEILTKLKVAAH